METKNSIINYDHNNLCVDGKYVPFSTPARFHITEATTSIQVRLPGGGNDCLYEGIVAHCSKSVPRNILKQARAYLLSEMALMDKDDIPEVCNEMILELDEYLFGKDGK